MSHRHHFSITFEWEDLLSQGLGVPVVREKRYVRRKFYRLFPGLPTWLQTGRKSFAYEMSCIMNNRYNNKANIVPNIIDFYVKDADLPIFCREYRNNPAVLISSREAYERLIELGIGDKLPLHHCALSLSDQYRITADSHFEKFEDLILLGRPNPVLKEYLDIYTSKHPNFVWAEGRRQGDEVHVYNNKGEYLGPATTRDEYMRLMRRSRCALYSLPGIDGDEDRTAGYSQVTPRLLEFAACGCNIIPRYRSHADTKYFGLDLLGPSIDSYEEFEAAMDRGRETTPDIKYYAEWLSKHYTSERVKTIKSILEQL